MKKPNVLFILSDQHSAKVLGHKGHPDVQTPNLDRLAAEGVRFDNAISQNPICTPSRMSFLSGLYCHNHGFFGLSGPTPQGLPTVLGQFRAAGYRTAAIGKIHCPDYWIEADSDVFHETCGCSVGGQCPEYAGYLAERGLTDLEDHTTLTEFGKRGQQSMEGRPSQISYESSQEGWSVQKAMQFMKDCSEASKPFFAHVSLPKPHQCYAPARPFWDLYDESKITLPANADASLEGKAPHLQATAAKWRRGDWLLFEPKTFEAGRLRKLHGYLGCISHVDHAVGELLEWLESNNLSEDTIVVYSSDHGDYACEFGIMEKAPGICSDAITRIPMIWRWPGRFKPGHVAREIVESVDLSSTLCALAGLEPMKAVDGKDLSPLLEGKEHPVHEIGVTECAWSKSVRKGKFRMVHYVRNMFAEEYPEGFGELYDLEQDPWEMKNLFFEPAYADVVESLHRDLTDWLITTSRTTHPPVVTKARDPNYL